eukprot:4130899-Pleurochrysis_carterae.AAC.1
MVLYCDQDKADPDGKPYFIFSSWTVWQRAQLPRPDVLTSTFDPEDDDSVRVASASRVAAMEH